MKFKAESDWMLSALTFVLDQVGACFPYGSGEVSSSMS